MTNDKNSGHDLPSLLHAGDRLPDGLVSGLGKPMIICAVNHQPVKREARFTVH